MHQPEILLQLAREHQAELRREAHADRLAHDDTAASAAAADRGVARTALALAARALPAAALATLTLLGPLFHSPAAGG